MRSAKATSVLYSPPFQNSSSVTAVKAITVYKKCHGFGSPFLTGALAFEPQCQDSFLSLNRQVPFSVKIFKLFLIWKVGEKRISSEVILDAPPRFHFNSIKTEEAAFLNFHPKFSNSAASLGDVLVWAPILKSTPVVSLQTVIALLLTTVLFSGRAYSRKPGIPKTSRIQLLTGPVSLDREPIWTTKLYF